jgi:hypothetical protein
MRPLAEIEAQLDGFRPQAEAHAGARVLLELSEEALEHWITAHGEVPTEDRKEGFRLLALQRQGTRGIPSFNACRESCREIAYHYNLLVGDHDPAVTARTQRMMCLLAKHLFLFVSGKMQVERLGEFCCAARPLRVE